MAVDESPVGGRRIVAPYVTSWSEEETVASRVVVRPGGGIAYADERVLDRDEHGVLWSRTPWSPGVGRPVFGRVHPVRQRRAMQRLLCQVCAGPADRDGGGVLWLLKDHREDWPGWPNQMGVTEPPVCRACVRLSVRVCPALRRGAVTVRAGSFPVAGVNGVLHQMRNRVPVAVGQAMVTFDDPLVRWVRAAHLVRWLDDCTVVPIDTVIE